MLLWNFRYVSGGSCTTGWRNGLLPVWRTPR